MKLIIAGATGFVGTEITLQALASPDVKSVVALTRRPLELRAGSDTTKLSNVVLEDFGHYSDKAKKQLADADACIWTVAVTPTKAKEMDPATVKVACYDNTLSGLDAIMEARTGARHPLRFMYVSGIAVTRDASNIPDMVPSAMRPYVIMRGEVENALVVSAANDPSKLSVSCARPGLITSQSKPAPAEGSIRAEIDVGELVAVMLDQVSNGFEKDPLDHKDLVRLSEQVTSLKTGT